ncbi:hypothetical protein PRIPAC_97010 [Pristionchus pacificus]|uniref:Cytochrome P450 n=1 Tax=Pristionchus pacificus TaxID=54126 RepID=A0A2A6D2Q5_PRIPA|nr:hypothetical protein PRIPAC_97010 [Pristionchus pacificus]|eukprot:PDM84714.1 cytochrome P450 [Pristionchus pacificus]
MIGALLVAVFILSLIINRIFDEIKFLKLREELGLRGPPTDLFIGNCRYFYKIAIERGIEASPYICAELVHKFGSTFGSYIGREFEIVTTDPAIIKEVFISQFRNFVDRRRLSINRTYPTLDGLLQVGHKGTYGVGWKEIRSVISVIFTSASMKKMHLMFHDQIDNLIDVLRNKCRINNGKMDIYGEYQAMTMDMIARCALGQNISCIKDRNNDYYSCARTFFANLYFEKSLIFRLAIFIPIFRHLRQFTNFGRAEKIIINKLSASIRERERDRADGIIRKLPDVIDLILAENEKRVENGKIPLHHDVVVSNAWALFIAGYETTSSALAYASYLLAKHPEVQATLHEEIHSTFGDADTIDYERVMRLPNSFQHAVFCETLRFYPPVTSLTGRTCIKETIIGGKIRVPVGVGVVAPVHAVMWSEENFVRPREFIPERFLNDKRASAWSATYLPFGIGPRNCVGARFAEMEFKTVLAAVIRCFVIELDLDHIELHTVMGNVLQSPKGNQLFVRLVERRTGAEEEWESLGADSGIDDCEI